MTSNGLRQHKKHLVKQALYDAAIELFRQKGFNEASVDEISRRAGFSRATFFNHFKTKQGVLRVYGQRLVERVEMHLETASPSTAPLELIRQIIMLMVHEAEMKTEEVRVVCMNSILDQHYISGPTPSRLRLFEILTRLVTQAQNNAQVRNDLDARDLATHIFMLYQGVVYALITGADNRKSLAHSAWQLILQGVNHDAAAR